MNRRNYISTVVLLTLGIIVFFTACGKDEVDYGLDEYRVNLATVKIMGSKPVFILDNGVTLFNEGDIPNLTLNDGQRVRLNYSYLSYSVENVSYAIKINGIRQIPLGELQATSQAKIDNLPNDPIEFESVWVGSHYLNMTFRIKYYSVTHKIQLLADSTQLGKNEIRLFFRHDNNNDAPGYENNAIASYDLYKILGEPSNKVLLVNFHTSNYGDTVFTVKY